MNQNHQNTRGTLSQWYWIKKLHWGNTGLLFLLKKKYKRHFNKLVNKVKTVFIIFDSMQRSITFQHLSVINNLPKKWITQNLISNSPHFTNVKLRFYPSKSTNKPDAVMIQMLNNEKNALFLLNISFSKNNTHETYACADCGRVCVIWPGHKHFSTLVSLANSLVYVL